MKIAVITSADEQFVPNFGNAGAIVAALEALEHKVLVLKADETLAISLLQEKPDTCIIAMVDAQGAKGDFQALLEFLDIPFVGASSAACHKAADRSLLPSVLHSYRRFSGDDVSAVTPVSFSISVQAYRKLGAAAVCGLAQDRVPGGYPLCVKPASGCMAQDVFKVEDEAQLVRALDAAFENNRHALVQQWIEGVEVSVCLLGEGWDAFTLPAVEIVPDGPWFDAEARERGFAQFIAPVRPESLSPDPVMASAIRAEIERAAFDAYYVLGMRDYGRVDIVWDGAQAHVLEVQANPSLATGSIFRKALDAAGLSLDNVLNAMCGGMEF